MATSGFSSLVVLLFNIKCSRGSLESRLFQYQTINHINLITLIRNERKFRSFKQVKLYMIIPTSKDSLPFFTSIQHPLVAKNGLLRMKGVRISSSISKQSLSEHTNLLPLLEHSLEHSHDVSYNGPPIVKR